MCASCPQGRPRRVQPQRAGQAEREIALLERERADLERAAARQHAEVRKLAIGVAHDLVGMISEPFGQRRSEPAIWSSAIAPTLNESAFCAVLQLTGQDISRYTREGVVELPVDAGEIAGR